MAPLTDTQITALARDQLGLNYTQIVPKAYKEQLKTFLDRNPYDTNFTVELTPQRGYGILHCQEEDCKGTSIYLKRDPVVRDGGMSAGMGTFAEYKIHIQTHPTHFDSRQRRLVRAKVNASSSPATSKPQRAGASSSSHPAPSLLQKISGQMSTGGLSTGASSSVSKKRLSDPGYPLEGVAKRVKTEDQPLPRPALSQRTNLVKPEPQDDARALSAFTTPGRAPTTTQHSSNTPNTATPQQKMFALKQMTELRQTLTAAEDELGRLLLSSAEAPTIEAQLAFIDQLKDDVKRCGGVALSSPKLEADVKPYIRTEIDHPCVVVKPQDDYMPPGKPEPELKPLVPLPVPAVYPQLHYAVPGPSRAASYAGPALNNYSLPTPDHVPHDADYLVDGRHLGQLPLGDSDDEGDFPFNPIIPRLQSEEGIDAFLRAAGNAENFEKAVTVHDALKHLNLRHIEQQFHKMTVNLMAHQVLGVAWMNKQEVGINKGGIMADEMGLGKTVQMMATMCFNPPNLKAKNAAKGTLIVGPLALLDQWKDEIEMKTRMGWNVLVYHGKTKPQGRGAVDILRNYDVVLTSYGTLSHEWPENDEFRARKEKAAQRRKRKSNDFIELDSEDDKRVSKKSKKKEPLSRPLFDISWHRVVLDEAQNVRNRGTRVSQAVCDIQAELRWCLTGTPLTNSTADAYGLIRFLRIRPWWEWHFFNPRISQIERKNPDLATKRLQAIFKTCLVRRKKDTELDGRRLVELPEKIRHEEELQFMTEEQEIYNFIQARSRAIFNRFLRQGTVLKNYHQVLVLLLRLRQCAVHPSLIAEYEDAFLLKGEVRESGEDKTNELYRAENLMGPEWVELVKAHFLKLVQDRIQAEKQSADASIADECPICLEVLTEGLITPCKHVFCKDCTDNVFSQPIAEDAANPVRALREDERPCPSCRQTISKGRLFDREAFMPTDKELGIVDPDAPPSPARTKGKRKVKSKSTTNDSTMVIGDDDDDEVPRWSNRTSKKTAYEGDSEDSMDYFIVADGESETEKDAKREAKSKLGKSKSKGKGKMRVDDSDDEYEGSQAEEADEDNSEVEFIDVSRYDYMARLGVSDNSKKPPMLAKFLPSTKMLRMMELLESIRDNSPDDKVIVVSQWTSALELCAGYLAEKKIHFVRYYGSMNQSERTHAVRGLMDDDNVRVMLLSLKAGGVGLNLTRANHVISLDFAWSEAVEAQAFDRTHRLGQKKPVQIHRLAIKGTVEGKVIELQARKKDLADGSLGEGKTKMGRLTVRQLAGLFGLDVNGHIIE